MAWHRLSVRDGRSSGDDGPFEGVPRHLFEPLRDWIDQTFGGMPMSQSNAETGVILAAAIHFGPARSKTEPTLTVRRVTEEVVVEAFHGNTDLLLDAVDAVLHMTKVDKWSCNKLNSILELGGSVWRVHNDCSQLVRRVDETALVAHTMASSEADTASTELNEAWGSAYGRSPNASDAWDHSIKAVEAALIPIVTPAKAKATLGDVVGTLKSQEHIWLLGLPGHDDTSSVAPLVAMLRLIWPNPDRHGGNQRQPTIGEAQGVVNLAVTIVQWSRAGLVSKRSS